MDAAAFLCVAITLILLSFIYKKFFLVISDIILSGVVNLCSDLFFILVWCSTCGSKTKEKGKINLDWSIVVFFVAISNLMFTY